MTRDEKIFNLTFPLLEAHSRVSDALERAKFDSAPAIVSTNGSEYWLHDIALLKKRKPAETLSILQGLAPPNAAKASIPAPVISAYSESAIRSLFPNRKMAVVIASEVHNFAGERMVVAFTNPAGAFYVVGDVWECPKDLRKFSSPGICPTHFVTLRKTTK
jgi:hypothetical protein